MKNCYLFSTLLGTLLMMSFSFIISSCQRPFDNATVLLKIDTLQQLAKTIDQTLVLDEDAFKTRNDSMIVKLNVVKPQIKDTTNGETKSSIVRYDGIHENYEDFLKNYPLYEFDCDKHKKIVEDIKQNVLSKKMDQPEFDKTYQSEKSFLESLLAKSKTMTYNTYSIEEDYRRTDPVVTKLYHEFSRK